MVTINYRSEVPMKTLIILLALILLGYLFYNIIKTREEEMDEFEENKYNYFRGHLK